jgi:hypothetical protein
MNTGSGGLAACSTRGARAAQQRRADTDKAGGAGISDDKARADVSDDKAGDDHADDVHAGGDAGANDLRP